MSDPSFPVAAREGARFSARFPSGDFAVSEVRRFRSQNRASAAVCVVASAFSLTFLIFQTQAALADEHLRRIYFLESLAPNLPAAARTIDAFKQRLSQKNADRFEIFVDYMDLVRFPSKTHRDKTAQYLAAKYAEEPPDVLITLGRAALSFMVEYRDMLAPHTPKILVSVPLKEATQPTPLENAFWVPTNYDYSKTLELAQQLHPRAQNAVVGGGSAYDQQWLDDVRHQFELHSRHYHIRYIAGLSYADTLNEVARLPKDTIVIMSFFFADGAGRPFLSPDVAEAVAKVAPSETRSPRNHAWAYLHLSAGLTSPLHNSALAFPIVQFNQSISGANVVC